MKCSLLLAIALATLTLTFGNNEKYPLSDDFINSINNKKTTWKAGRNFASNTSFSKLKNLLKNVPKLLVRTHVIDAQDVPLTFDAREAWPECASIIGNILLGMV
ncbi:hypothetical protein Zmor_007226 [Zophobas morio]|uniref:Peptidase C1A propeptide domain-containing protein n=1 Tax=Zophobas morio TaxID=2755281 RepID=A0AA38IWZ4_9CUCU|nr:hypothetical protein Zmor_007226 [Zophobas morio]